MDLKSDQNERLHPPDRIGVTHQHTQTVPGLAPQPQFTVKTGGPEAEVANGEAGDAAASIMAL